jgi:glycerate-2-kinase
MKIIQNYDALAVSALRTDALAIAEAGYMAVDVADTIRRKIRLEGDHLHIGDTSYPLTGRKVFFVGIGKCAIRAGRAIEALLGEALTSGIMFDVSADPHDGVSKMETFIGTHPLPSNANMRASKHIVEFLSGRQASDLVIMLISGGGSTFLSLPDAPMTPADESELFKELTAHGAPIQDLNVVRKHISRARGGALAVAAHPAEIVSLIVSDVPGDDIGIISSGPTVLDSSTLADAQAILKKYDTTLSERIVFLETEKDEKYFERVANVLFLSSQDALTSMQEEARSREYTVRIVDTHFTGEARDTAHAVAENLHESLSKTVLLYAGESTVTLAESTGKGGRNQEMALAALVDIRSDELILPFASDGHDNTEHAGAISDEMSRVHAVEKNLSIEGYLDAHRSYDFFTATGDALVTGYTGSNVSDLIVAIKA